MFSKPKHLKSKRSAPLIGSFFLSAVLLFSGLQVQQAAVAAAPTCASPWFKDVDSSNDYTGVLVCDYTVTSGTNVDLALNLPEGVTEVYVVAVGGGGGGGGGGGVAPNQTAGGGGGAGQVITDGLLTGLSSSSTIRYTVGTGGAGGTVPDGSLANGGSNGGSTVVSIGGVAQVTALGGQGGAGGDGFTPGGGGQSGSGLSGGTGTGFAGGGGGGTLAEDYQYEGVWYRGAGANGSDGSGASTRKGGNGGEAGYFVAPYSGFPFTGYLIGQDTADTDVIDFMSSIYGGPGGVVGGASSGEACTHTTIVDGEEVSDFYQYGTTGFSQSGDYYFLDSHGSCAYSDGGANGRAMTEPGVGSGGAGGAGSDDTISMAGLGSDGNGGALWLRYVLNYFPTIDTRIVIPTSTDGDGATVPSPSNSTESSDIGTLNPGEGVEFTSTGGHDDALNDALYINGELYGDGTYLTHPVPFRYEDLLGYAKELGIDVCSSEITVTYKMYDPDTSNELASASVTMAADPTDESCSSGGGGGGGGSAGGVISKPDKPSKYKVTLNPGSKTLDIDFTYGGTNAKTPSQYKVTVSPGGKTCTAYGANSSCEISDLEYNRPYKLTYVAINKFGSSAIVIDSNTYILTVNGLALYKAKKTITNFPGDSPTLLPALRAKIDKFLEKRPKLTVFTCTGYTAGPAKKSDRALAKQRANNVCEYIKQVKPAVEVFTSAKTPGRPWGASNRKVVIRGFSG